MPGTREVNPTRPWLPGGRPVPSEVRLVAVVDGTHAVPGALALGQRGEEGCRVRVALQQLGAEGVDQEHDVRRRRGQHQVERRTAGQRGRRAEGLGDRGHHVREGPASVRGIDEVVQVGHAPRVRDDSDSAKASSPATASAPSAAAETRSEKSSPASTPV